MVYFFSVSVPRLFIASLFSYTCCYLSPITHSGSLLTHSHLTNIQNNQTACTTHPLKNPHNRNFYNLIVGNYHYQTNKSRALSYQPPCTKIVEPYLCSLIPDGGRVNRFCSAKINCSLLLINESSGLGFIVWTLRAMKAWLLAVGSISFSICRHTLRLCLRSQTLLFEVKSCLQVVRLPYSILLVRLSLNCVLLSNVLFDTSLHPKCQSSICWSPFG